MENENCLQLLHIILYIVPQVIVIHFTLFPQYKVISIMMSIIVQPML